MIKLNCTRCKARGEDISPRHMNERKCGFSEAGLFDDDNYCCSTLLDIRAYCELVDEISIIHYEDDNTVYFKLGGDTLKLMWYKSRGRTSTFTFANGKPVDVGTAERLLAGLEEKHGPLEKLRERVMPTPEQMTRIQERIRDNSVYGKMTDRDHPLYGMDT